MLRLASAALADCLEGKGIAPPPLFLALPEHEAQYPLDQDALLDDLSSLAPERFDRAKSRADWKGRAGGLLLRRTSGAGRFGKGIAACHAVAV